MADLYLSKKQRLGLTTILALDFLAIIICFFAFSVHITDAGIAAAALTLVLSGPAMALLAWKKTWLFALALTVNTASAFMPTLNGIFSANFLFFGLAALSPNLVGAMERSPNW